MNIESKDLELLIKQVLENVLPQVATLDTTDQVGQEPVVKTYHSSQIEKVDDGDYGVFNNIEQAIEAAHHAQKIYVKQFQLKDRERLIKNIRTVCSEHVKEFAQMCVDETKLGRIEDKIQKNELVIEKTPGTECLKTAAISGDDGLTIIECAPFGVIGAVTPVTNPTETIINNVISMIAGGNSVVFNVHPSAKKSCAYCLKVINKAIESAGGPKNLATMVKNPTLETVATLSKHPKIKLLAGTGGTKMVTQLLKSGKKVIGAGAGNPPVIVDETADLKHASQQIYFGASFDNNLLCLAEKEVFVLDSVANEFIYNMVEEGSYLLTNAQLKEVIKLVFSVEDIEGKPHYHVKKEWVGQNAEHILNAIGVHQAQGVKLIICEVDAKHPLVLTEQLMPILPIVKCQTLEEAINHALLAENGNRHTASMFSKNIDHLTAFAREIETTIFVKNACTLAGVGYGGEGHTTMTIAGPTGEGITNAASFTRQRRCSLAEGGFRII